MAQEQVNLRIKLQRLARRLGLLGVSKTSMIVTTICVLLALISTVALVGLVLVGQKNHRILDKNEEVLRLAEQKQEKIDEVSQSTPQEEASISIHIAGAVKNPGLYTLTGEALRVADAIEAAGGVSDEAETNSLNLAEIISDGQKIYVPKIGEQEAAIRETTRSENLNNANSQATQRININTAGVDELKNLPGVGESTAKRIVDDRNKNGKFTTVEDLMRVSGIGEKKFAKLKAYIYV